ncbi:MAG: hypothetical protein A2857_05860 [Candidatus Levybacteria bacterium RIFCSPHIGHO2_01_FULL_36_15]|nr:MAG: hypothetical protein A2857_05860 [Candidatus Levybacteria bacterium RIFCSPHIGHO2_01_FULL_36_15]OGH38419.1 MAG: hypothetical protein A2905_00660 [Candidatus Levybacteria bacterium RIFCSPLOWO2_01_FULL_36_10]
MHLNTVKKYIRRSPYQAIAAILIMTLTFFAISVFSILTVFSIKFINYFETRPQLTVFFQDEAKKDEVNALKKKLDVTGKVSSMRYVSKEEALKIYREQNKSDPILLDLVTADILPASLEIQATKAEYLSDLAKIVKTPSFVEEVVFQKDVIDTLVSWTSAVKKIGIGIISVLLLVSIFVIVTIIGIRITIRREEIEIMRLIGATNWFIRMPFIIEGMFYGFIGAFLGSVFAAILLVSTSPFLETFFKSVPIFPISYVLLLGILGVEVIFACFLGAFASFVAVLRYLK